MSVRRLTAPLFDDRGTAGRRLARELAGRAELADGPILVVGLARGGVPVAAEVARVLEAPLATLVVKKVGHPLQPEFGLGAVTPGGGVYVREPADLSPEELDRVIARTRAQAEEKAARLERVAPAPDPKDAVCVIVDDGLATGATLIAAARWARVHEARRVLAAVPVASTEGAAMVSREVDAFVCPYITDRFWAVSVWYRDFPQVDDAEVEEIMRAEIRVPPPTRPAAR
jgi:putative phosphoribosyl transferase